MQNAKIAFISFLESPPPPTPRPPPKWIYKYGTNPKSTLHVQLLTKGELTV